MFSRLSAAVMPGLENTGVSFQFILNVVLMCYSEPIFTENEIKGVLAQTGSRHESY